jgi:3-hydroxyacyl-CoA dehydrogenase
VLNENKQSRRMLRQCRTATFYDFGDGVGLVEFNCSQKAWDWDTLTFLVEVFGHLEEEFAGLVIGNEVQDFSTGVDPAQILGLIRSKQWELLGQLAKRIQDLHQQMRFSPRPVVVAPSGKALGGGCEMVMHGNRVVAAAGVRLGQVELGLGLLPFGGGTKELLRRTLNPAMRVPGVEAQPFLQRVFELIGQARVSVDAEEARQLGFLGAADRVVVHGETLLAEAKREVLHMIASGYRPLVPEPLYAGGQDARATLQINAWTYHAGGFISEYDNGIAAKLAHVLSGGNLSRPAWVSEQYLLDLEREAFLSLCGEERTQARLSHFLQTGKPLRN